LREDQKHGKVYLVLAAGRRKEACSGVARKDNNIGGILISYQQPSIARINREITGGFASTRNLLDLLQSAVYRVDQEHCNRICATIRNV
jgi:hypothetical protein